MLALFNLLRSVISRNWRRRLGETVMSMGHKDAWKHSSSVSAPASFLSARASQRCSQRTGQFGRLEAGKHICSYGIVVAGSACPLAAVNLALRWSQLCCRGPPIVIST